LQVTSPVLGLLDPGTEIAVVGTLTKFETSLLSHITKRIFDENVFYTALEILVEALMALVWFKRLGKQIFLI
jgi:hypothetical protein